VEAIINHNNDVTKQSWEKTQHISRKCYLVDNGPGTISDEPTSGLKPELDNFDYTKEESEEGYKNFTVIQCKIKSIEWLYLAAKGHRRARFDLENNKDNNFNKDDKTILDDEEHYKDDNLNYLININA